MQTDLKGSRFASLQQGIKIKPFLVIEQGQRYTPHPKGKTLLSIPFSPIREPICNRRQLFRPDCTHLTPLYYTIKKKKKKKEEIKEN